jgi:endonuclease/exonuclease/phosphatase family metal-dependent hydrolase
VAVVAWNVSAAGGDVLDFLETAMGLRCGNPPTSPIHAVFLFQEALRRDWSVPPAADGYELQPTVSERKRDRERLDIVTIAQRCGLSFVYVPSARNGTEEYEDGREDLGNAIVSTLPLRDPFAIELPQEATRRVATGVTAQLPSGHALRVVSVHFNTFPAPWKLLRTGNSSRVRQALALGEGLVIVEGQPSAEPLPTIAGGDLNTWSTQEGAFHQMLRLFPESPEWPGEPTRGSYPTDHLFFRNASVGDSLATPRSYRRLPNDYDSDHHPIIAWLALPSP